MAEYRQVFFMRASWSVDELMNWRSVAAWSFEMISKNPTKQFSRQSAGEEHRFPCPGRVSPHWKPARSSLIVVAFRRRAAPLTNAFPTKPFAKPHD